MLSLAPSLNAGQASANLDRLISRKIDVRRFENAILHLQRRFEIYTSTCPAPFVAPGLIVTPEIRRQCELYLPVAEIGEIFNKLYRSALNYPPILSSTIFHNPLSWAETFVGLPSRLQFSANPALLLETLLADGNLLTEFLFASFLPQRFYGGFERYPAQREFIRKWLVGREIKKLRCMDSACGTGEDSYGLAGLLLKYGLDSKNLWIEGWTIEPLEVWAAAHCRFPHDQQREEHFRSETARIFQQGYDSSVVFRCADLIDPPPADQFDLILCNGLLGGPIINRSSDLKRVLNNLAALLAPSGMLLVADSFHAGWKQKCPQQMLRTLFEDSGLQVFEAGEGLGGSKPGQQSIFSGCANSEPH